MPVNETKKQLRAVLVEKSVEELEELLALEFSEEEGFEPDMDYITEIMGVIREKESQKEDNQVDVSAAWKEFQEYAQARSAESSETGNDEEPSNSDHICKPDTEQKSRKKPSRILRYVLVAAAVVVLLCGTAFASEFKLIFQALADWTAETFSFLVPGQEEPPADNDPFLDLRLEVARLTDTPVVPKWAPEGTVSTDQRKIVEREDRTRVRETFLVGDREFTIQIVIHDSPPDIYTGTYQKDDVTEEVPYVVGTVSHYIMSNNETVSVMWANGCVEGYIQGTLTVEQIKDMIDSIYEE